MSDETSEAPRAEIAHRIRAEAQDPRCRHESDFWFDRTICPEPCGSMHNRCDVCGSALEPCPVEFEAGAG